MNIVSVEDVTRIYTQGRMEVRALDSINLTLPASCFAALAGPSGSGKTTLLNLMGGLDSPTSGRVVLDGSDLSTMSRSELAHMRMTKVGFVFQAYNLIPVLSAQENVEYVMQLQNVPAKERRDRARAMLDDVGLADRYNRRPSELSGGQQQRVAVARAIVSNPSIVLADEPTANLDSKTGQGLLEIMREMNTTRGVSFVFSTHDQMVMDYATTLVRLQDGHITSVEHS